MAGMSGRDAAIVILGEGSLALARRVQAALPGAVIHGLAGRASGADRVFEDFGAALRQLFADDVPIVAISAAGIVIRTLAPLLKDKRAEPPVLALAEDGSAVVPLLGGLRGVNALARAIGTALGTVPAITTSGEVRFAATLEHPPAGYELRNPHDAKRFMSDLLAGERVKLSGEAAWLSESRLPFDPAGRLALTVTPREREAGGRELLYHPHSVAVAVALASPRPDLPRLVLEALARHGLSRRAVAAVFAAEGDVARPEIHAVAVQLARPLRLLPTSAATAAEEEAGAASLAGVAVPDPAEGPFVEGPIAIAVAAAPIATSAIGRGRGKLTVVGLGPGAVGWLAPDARKALDAAEDIVGYASYLSLAGPFRAKQALHASDNREEMARARHALALAARGREVAVLSSGDPGVFAMAAAVMEALDGADDPAWLGVELAVVPGISAAHAAAARAGAPLGHDFCVLSLSDNLKPWEVIEERLRLAAAADLALALYNPLSQARPWQFGRALEIIREQRRPQTPVVLGRNIGRAGECVRVLPLGELTSADVDMLTTVIVGSSTTRSFPRLAGGSWVYTPRVYAKPPGPLSET
jgi:cobalt-precorrin 5A hydrolase / precorrin-3B C17-methyltransferase